MSKYAPRRGCTNFFILAVLSHVWVTWIFRSLLLITFPFQLVTASSCIIGTVFALLVDSATAGFSKAFFLPFTCGGFMYIALVTLVPNLTKEEDPKWVGRTEPTYLRGECTVLLELLEFLYYDKLSWNLIWVTFEMRNRPTRLTMHVYFQWCHVI